jgi:hypothetical protein
VKIDLYFVNGEACIPLDQVAAIIKQANPLAQLNIRNIAASAGIAPAIEHNAFLARREAEARQYRDNVPVGISGEQLRAQEQQRPLG